VLLPIPDRFPEWWERVRFHWVRSTYLRELNAYRSTGKTVVHLLHIGKTGGSAIKDALANSRDTGTHRIEFHSHGFHFRDVPTGDKIVFFVRDPLSRFVSGFYSRMRQGLPRYHSPWTIGERAAFARFKTPNQLGDALSSADRRTRAAAARAMTSIAHVRSSYWDWFESEDYYRSRSLDVLFVGAQETLNDDFEALKLLFGLPSEVALPNDDLRAHRNPQGLDRHLEPKAIANLTTWYAEDYRFLQICANRSEQSGLLACAT